MNILSSSSFSQNVNAGICDDDDCPPELFSIKMKEPSTPSDGKFSNQRTKNFEDAYLAFQKIKDTYVQKGDWKKKYGASQISGKSCIRHYQLESYFANEYVQNPTFKTFVDKQKLEGSDYVRKGFNDSRKGLNLKVRMESRCSDEVRDVERVSDMDLDALTKEYTKMGQELGYFDDEGNLIKPIEIPEEELTSSQQSESSKREQIDQLVERVSALPLGQPVTDKIDNTSKELKAAKPRAQKLVNFLKTTVPVVAELIASQIPVVNTITKVFKVVEELTGWNPKISNSKLVDKIIKLFDKGKKLKETADMVLGKSKELKDSFAELGDQAQKNEEGIDASVENIEALKEKLAELKDKKKELEIELDDNPSNILDKLMGTVSDVEKEAKDLLDQAEKARQEKDRLLKQLAELEKKRDELMAEKDGLESDANDLSNASGEYDQEATNVAQEVDEVKKEIDEKVLIVEELKQEEEALKEEFGKDIKLEPVTTEEWAESFEVEREYWDAVFHPDDEVVEGYKGRWFQIQLKDASKNVKLLFGPGEYFMSKGDFRNNYGSVIGAFVTEALHSLKKSEQAEIQLFVQGSADISGQNTFRGNLDSRFYYDEVTIFPYVPATDGFMGTAINKSIPKENFTNKDLPNLRGRFLKEMISVYSKKLQPVLLEGTVKEEVDSDDRNAVIYLFIPETIVAKYGN